MASCMEMMRRPLQGGSSSAGQQLVQQSHRRDLARPKLQDFVHSGTRKPLRGGREYPQEPALGPTDPLNRRSLSKHLSSTYYVLGCS